MIKYLNKLTKGWILFHLLFWVLIIVTTAVDIIEYSSEDMRGYTLSILIRVIQLAVLIYFNLFVLIPIFYKKKKIVLYLISIIILSFLFALTFSPVYFITTNNVIELQKIDGSNIYIQRSLVGLRYILISLLLNYTQERFEEDRKYQQLKIQKISAELNYLRAQINPHFLFNTLNNLYGLTLNKSDKAPEMVLKLSDIMEYMLYESSEIKVPIEKEVKNLQNYLAIEKMRQGNNAHIQFDVTGDLNSKFIVPHLLLTLLENAFKHGINKMPFNAFLIANLEITTDELIFTIKNGKPPETGEITFKKNGIGLINFQKRLDLFYETRYTLVIEDMQTEYKTTLTIRLA